MIPEYHLPPAILEKASVRGREYAWPLNDVEAVVAAARECNLANLGGQAQFRVPEGTCELYWLQVGSTPHLPNESWREYVSRSAEEVARGFQDLCARKNFVQEGIDNFSFLRELQARGVDLGQYLCFVLYFEAEPA